VRWPGAVRAVLRLGHAKLFNLNVTVFDVEDLNLVGLVGVNTAVTGCRPTQDPDGPDGNAASSNWFGTAKVGCSWTVPAALGGAPRAMGTALPPNPDGQGF
jgi:hypothetical protein